MNPLRPTVLRRFLPWIPSLITVLLRLLCLDDFMASPFFKPLGGDRGLYDRLALAISQGHGINDIYTFLPCYPYLLGGLYTLLGGANLAAASILQALLDGVTARLIFNLALCRYGRAAAFLAALGFALLGPAIAYSLVTMPVSLGLFWTALAATCAERWKDSWSWIKASGMGIFLGIGGHILGAFWLMIPLFAAWIAIVSVTRPASRRVFQVLLVIVLGYACLLPSLHHNFKVSREWIPVSAHAGLNLYMGNNPACEGYGTALPGLRLSAEEMTRDSVSLASQLTGQPLNLTAANRFWQIKARQFWTDQPMRALRLLALKLHRLVSIRDFDDTGLCRLLPNSVPALKFGIVSFGSIWLLACIGYGIRPTKASFSGSWIMGVCIAGGMLLTFVTARYRLPLAVLLLPAAGGTLAAIPSLFRATRRIYWPRFTIGLFGCMAAAIPHGMPDTTLADSINLSAYWQQQGNSQKALQYAQQAMIVKPDSTDASFALGNAWLSKNDYIAALSAFQRVLISQPERTDALYNAGLALEYLGRKAEAQTCYEQVIALDHRHAKAWFALAILYRDLGKPEQARQAIVAAAGLVGWNHPEIVKFQAAQPR